MDEEVKKAKRATLELVEQMRRPGGLLDPQQFQQLIELAKQHKIMMDQVQKVMQPVLDSVVRTQEAMKSAREPITMTYYRPVEHLILDALHEIRDDKKIQTPKASTEILIVYDRKDSCLNRSIEGKCFSYDLTEDGKRKKLLDTLLDRDAYVKTGELSKILKCPSNPAVAKMVQTFNEYAQHALHLKKVKLIEGKKGSGYRINPKIHIVRE